MAVFPAFSEIKISEVMRNPVEGKTNGRAQQYIEIINFGDESVCVAGMRLFTGAITNTIQPIPKGAISQGITGTTEIQSGQIAIILTNQFEQFSQNIPDSAVVLMVGNTSLCGGFAADDGFVILSANDTIAECRNGFENGRFKCRPNGNEARGISIVPQSLFENTGVWNVQNPSVGKIKHFNHGVLREYKIERKDGVFEISIKYRNFGKNASVNNIKLMQNFGEIILEKELASSLIFAWKIGDYPLFDTIFTADMFVKENSVVITEVDSRAAVEWIELYWKDECFPLENWHLLIGGSIVNLPKLNCPKNRILCISEKESDDLVKMVRVPNWRKVNNFDDTIFLVAPFGVVDSIAWTREIFADSRDKSTVQRKDVNKCGFDPNNIFAGRATPGAILAPTKIQRFEIELSSRKFTPNGDGHLDSLVITAKKPRNGNVRIEIYEMSGNLLKTFESATQTRFVWDGKTEAGRLAQTGPVFVIGTFDDRNSKFQDRKNAILWR